MTKQCTANRFTYTVGYFCDFNFCLCRLYLAKTNYWVGEESVFIDSFVPKLERVCSLRLGSSRCHQRLYCGLAVLLEGDNHLTRSHYFKEFFSSAPWSRPILLFSQISAPIVIFSRTPYPPLQECNQKANGYFCWGEIQSLTHSVLVTVNEVRPMSLEFSILTSQLMIFWQFIWE